MVSWQTAVQPDVQDTAVAPAGAGCFGRWRLPPRGSFGPPWRLLASLPRRLLCRLYGELARLKSWQRRWRPGIWRLPEMRRRRRSRRGGRRPDRRIRRRCRERNCAAERSINAPSRFLPRNEAAVHRLLELHRAVVERRGDLQITKLLITSS